MKNILAAFIFCSIVGSVAPATLPFEPRIIWPGKTIRQLWANDKTASIMGSIPSRGTLLGCMSLDDKVSVIMDFPYSTCSASCVRPVASPFPRCQDCSLATGIACVEHAKDLRCDECKKNGKRWRVWIRKAKKGFVFRQQKSFVLKSAPAREVEYIGFFDGPELPAGCPLFLYNIEEQS